jgi:hypothetical protein
MNEFFLLALHNLAPAPLIMRLVEQRRLSKQEAAEIRKLLAKYAK